MDDFTMRMLHRAPLVLLIVAGAFLVGSILNAFYTYATFMRSEDYGGGGLGYLLVALFNAFYQPSILLGWAAAVHWLSVIADERRYGK
ncbi:hypothetical protein EF888_07850 [Silicimonas algicola]|uniref:Uncharacterized protein n=1 Tax=Silicimonas algicola TaxID=1826607 RepID=A0A316G416_9RHOB|nr:hypothetical protein [Silicimonas algicola]AZQ67054.1 hypothetical protein EF888_07850 [Silicimonas algicola]PWK55423.1 hypothetical protein C8D95_10789 [Silicimonas algicola]